MTLYGAVFFAAVNLLGFGAVTGVAWCVLSSPPLSATRSSPG
jgi:hypothetical protein